MIGRIDRHGRLEFPAAPETPARRKAWPDSVVGLALWAMAVLLAFGLTLSVTVALRHSVMQPDVPAEELILGPGIGTTR